MSDYPDIDNATSNRVFVDFAGGWRYSFPMVLDRDNSDISLVDWLVSKNVPRWLAEQEQNNLRIWSVPVGASTENFPPVNEER